MNKCVIDLQFTTFWTTIGCPEICNSCPILMLIKPTCLYGLTPKKGVHQFRFFLPIMRTPNSIVVCSCMYVVLLKWDPIVVLVWLGSCMVRPRPRCLGLNKHVNFEVNFFLTGVREVTEPSDTSTTKCVHQGMMVYVLDPISIKMHKCMSRQQ